MQKIKEEKSWIIAVRTTAKYRVYQKRLGVNYETKKRRYAKYCLVSQAMSMNRLLNKQATRVFLQFFKQSCNKHKLITPFQIFMKRVVHIQRAFRLVTSMKKTKRLLLDTLWTDYVEGLKRQLMNTNPRKVNKQTKLK